MNYYYITGTSKGIGKALAELLLNESGNVVYGLARGKTIEHDHYHHFPIDLSSTEETSAFRFHPHADADKLVLVNNAGTLGEVKYLGNLSSRSIINGFHVNLVSPALLMNNFIRVYKNLKAEKIIINISSGAAQSPYDGWSIYCSGKAGIEMMSKVGVREQELNNAYPFHIFSIAPGVVDTAMQAMNRSVEIENFSKKQKFIDLKENHQLASPEEAAHKLANVIAHAADIKETVFRV